MTPPGENGAGVKSARRVVELLDLLGRNKQGMSFTEIGDALALPKSSLHALLWTLVDQEWVVQDERDRRYRVGIRAWQAGQGFSLAADLSARAEKHLRAAVAELGETVQLGILDQTDVVYVAKVDGPRLLRLVSNVGLRLPAYATGIGKMLLASLDEEDLDALFPSRQELETFTSTTVKDVAALKAELRAIRRRGYSEDDGEYTPGVFCVAVPIFDHRALVTAAMSCTAPGRSLSDSHGAEDVPAILQHYAGLISGELGWDGTRPERLTAARTPKFDRSSAAP